MDKTLRPYLTNLTWREPAPVEIRRRSGWL